MPKSIVLEVSHPHEPPGPIQGFRFLWAFYVSGHRPDRHCQPCFKGRRVAEFCTGHAFSGTPVVLDRMDAHPFVYVCGVGVGPKRDLHLKNLHFPLEYREGAVAEATTYNGYVFRARNAAIVPIPPLPDGWHGLDTEHTRCKNFRFAVGAFGALPRSDGQLTSDP